MRLIIAGSRDFDDFDYLEHSIQRIISTPYESSHLVEIVSGTARGADKLGEAYAASYDVPIKRFEAGWTVNGIFDKAAGVKRNREMAIYGDELALFWDGKSRGSKNMMEEMLIRKKPIHIFPF